MGSARV
jgi:PAS domain-containing protein